MTKLAIHGGRATITKSFARYNTIGQEEKNAVNAVMDSGVLSQFLGTWHPDFYGGKKVCELEKNWSDFFGTSYAVSVNSATSGLIAALGAIGIEPGDEVIVSPWTMCATATSILVWNAIPVFADIEAETFNLDPASVRRRITPLTKAILVSDIFGHPARLNEIMAIAREHNVVVIEDCAQSPGARYHQQYAGTVAHIGVFSLNYHKHIHAGEGGVCVTNNFEYAQRMQLIRNHAEAVVAGKGVTNLANMIGFNFRLTEIGAAIACEQLKKLPQLVQERQEIAEKLSAQLRGLPGVRLPITAPQCTHAYFVYPLLVDQAAAGAARTALADALIAEGVSVGKRYENLHLLPMFQQRQAFGSKHIPWSANYYQGQVTYDKGICPVAEDLQDNRIITFILCLYQLADTDIVLIGDAFHKVWEYRSQLTNPHDQKIPAAINR